MKIFGAVLMIAAMLWMSGCSRQPFSEVKPAAGNAVLYVYWPESMNQDHTLYDVVIDGKVVGVVHNHCYIATEVSPGPVNVTIRDRDPIKAHLKKAQLQIDAVVSGAVYIKIGSPFSASVVDNTVGSQEIRDTELWEELDATIHMAGEEKAPAAEPAKARPSASEEIERLVALKEKGAITQEEYEILKARVISK
jgi:hypothetical protein